MGEGLRIAVVNSSSFGVYEPRHLKRLARIARVKRITVPPACSGAALAGRVRGCHAVIASVTPVYDRAFFASSPGLVLLARHGIGVNNVDVASATRHGVLVTKVPGEVEREAMAEHAVGLMLAAARRLRAADAAVRAGAWASRADFVGFELKRRTVGLIGFGNIGRRTGEILVRGFGARVLVRDPAVPAFLVRRAGARPATLPVLLKRADVISLHASLSPSSRRIIGAAAIRRMRRGVLLVNTARGGLVDERALAAALRAGKVGGYAADVVAAEPASGRHPLLRAPNTMVVPHIGAYTRESLAAMGEKMVRDVRDVFRRGRRPAELLNPRAWMPACRKR